MKNHHEEGHFKYRLMIGLLSLFLSIVMVDQSLAATSCSTCHEMPPLDSADGSRIPGTGAVKGSHQSHMGSSAVAAECTKCHGNSNYTNDHSKTSGNKININGTINGSPLTNNYSKGVLFNQTSVPVLGSCSNVNCHFERNLTTRTPAPVWGSKPTVDCTFCHATPRVASGSHEKHQVWYGDTASGNNASCTKCHPVYSTFNHATSAGKHKIVVNSSLNYTGGTPTSWLPSQSPSYGSCSTVTCHNDGTGVAVPITWNQTKAACSACHAAAPATGTHTAHLANLTAKYGVVIGCDDCHGADYVQGSTVNVTRHLNNNIDVINTGYPGTKVLGSAYTSCTAALCHSNGASGFTSVNWGATNTVGCRLCHPTLSAGHNNHLGNLFDAGTPISFYNYTSTKSLGSDYKFGCANCHPLAVSSHLNGAIEVNLTASASGGHLKALNGAGATMNGSKQCLNVYCHSNGYSANTVFVTTPVWGGSIAGDKCAGCHGNSPNSVPATQPGSSAHSAHVVGIHYDDIFNGVSRKLSNAGGASVNAAHGKNNRSTTINCNVCHAVTVTTSYNDKNTECSKCHGGSAPLVGSMSIADASRHINGRVDVDFINQKIATKAQVANTAFVAYTAKTSGWARNSNGMKFKTYTSSYDYTKSTLAAAASAYTTGAGCLNIACHASIPVKWTDTVTCTSCHTRLK